VSLKVWLKMTGLAVVAAALFAGCSSTPAPVTAQPQPLRVGVAREFPPFVFRSGDAYAGAEADFARRLSIALKRPLYFVQRNFEDLIPSLLSREIDIIMAGMTITDERKVRIAFSDYYLKGALGMAVRADQAGEFSSLREVLAGAQAVGVVGGTTSEAYVRRTFPSSIRVLLLGRPSDAAYELKARRIDVYVDDTPSIAWLASSNASEIRGLFEPLDNTTSYYGWGINKDNQELLTRANAALDTWKQDGTLDSILRRWLPYLKTYR
jgi:ABC-type amino acid transport substrate-binding protein